MYSCFFFNSNVLEVRYAFTIFSVFACISSKSKMVSINKRKGISRYARIHTLIPLRVSPFHVWKRLIYFSSGTNLRITCMSTTWFRSILTSTMLLLFSSFSILWICLGVSLNCIYFLPLLICLLCHIFL